MKVPARWTTPEQAEQDELSFWRRASAEERLSAVETLREATGRIEGPKRGGEVPLVQFSVARGSGPMRGWSSQPS
jgi:hypothetical protein